MAPLLSSCHAKWFILYRINITESPFCYMVLYILPWAERASPALRRSHGDPSDTVCSTNTSRSDVFRSGTLNRPGIAGELVM